MNSKIKNTFVSQIDQSDCGIACLLSIIQYYGGSHDREKLRQMSGTTEGGTTMLGLYQAALKLGFEAEGFEADVSHLKDINKPVILHTITHNKTQHYVVLYNIKEGKYLLGNPDFSIGLTYCSQKELEQQWVSKKMLVLNPTPKFIPQKTITQSKWSWFIKIVKEDVSFFTMASVFGALIALFGLATAIFSQQLFDQILPNESYSQLWLGIALLCILLIARSFLNYLRSLFLIRQSKDFNIRIIEHFYSAIINLPLNFFDNRKTGELIARMNDTRRIQNTISYVLGVVVIDVLIIISSVLFVFFYSTTIGLTVIASMLLFFALVMLYDSKIHLAQFEVMRSYALNESNYIDTVEGVETIKNYGKESYFSSITNTIYVFFQERIYNLSHIQIRFNLTIELLASLLIIGLLGLGSYLVLSDIITIGEIVAIISIVGGLIPAINRLTNANIQIQEAKVAFNRMYEFTSMKPEYLQQDEVILKIQALDVKDISFSFPGRSSLLHNINFSIQKGQQIAILGQSGIGKSTLLKILERHYQIDSGSITIDDKEINNIDLNSWRKLLGVVQQDVKIFNGSVIDNICLDNPSEHKDGVIAFCKEYGFDQFFEVFPDSYFTRIGEDGINISGGQKQLISIARALYAKPEILLLDEPTSAMDKKTERFVFHILSEIKDNVAVILVTHNVRIARHTDHIFVLEDGTIETSGKHETLMNSENLYSEAFNQLISSRIPRVAKNRMDNT
ncbi:MAG: peptidase domain-containing ABC transporter [Fulvivirga sp.]